MSEMVWVSMSLDLLIWEYGRGIISSVLLPSSCYPNSLEVQHGALSDSLFSSAWASNFVSIRMGSKHTCAMCICV